MKTKIIFPLPIVISAALVSQSTFAGPAPTPHDLQITEVSSSTLTVTDNGSMTGISVMNTSPDRWTVTLPYSMTTIFNTVEWTEETPFVFGGPQVPANDVTLTNNSSTFSVVSDIPNTTSTPIPNGHPAFGFIGRDTTNQSEVDMTFHDNGDAATTGVPETGSALGLLVLSLIALLGAKRLRSLRSA